MNAAPEDAPAAAREDARPVGDTGRPTGPEHDQLPRLNRDIAPVPGEIKRFYEDFVVEELPLYEPEGHGDHVFFRIEKEGLSTHRAVGDIARALGVRPGDIGVAGLKDAHAITRQTLSVEHIEPSRILALELPRIRVLSATRHPRKLRRGHLRANRFTIRLRGTDLSRIDDVRRILDVLARRGVPNYFGPQRFGARGDTGEVGRALMLGDADRALSLIAGSPGPEDTGDVRRARELFEAGDYRAAAEAWPRGYRHVARLSRAMAREKGDAARALRALDKGLRRFFVQAYQSWLFNQVVARRIDAIDDVMVGDLAVKHETGGVFEVEELEAERERARSFEISATGPLFGRKMRRPSGEPDRIEQEVLVEDGMRLEDFPERGPYRVDGARRALRFPVEDATVEAGSDEHGEFLVFRFTLPPGTYATALLREITGDDPTASRSEDGSSPKSDGGAP